MPQQWPQVSGTLAMPMAAAPFRSLSAQLLLGQVVYLLARMEIAWHLHRGPHIMHDMCWCRRDPWAQ